MVVDLEVESLDHAHIAVPLRHALEREIGHPRRVAASGDGGCGIGAVSASWRRRVFKALHAGTPSSLPPLYPRNNGSCARLRREMHMEVNATATTVEGQPGSCRSCAT